uniref:Structural protein n=1 Tax=Carnarvon virus TaxID=2776962 RepID=A0A8E4VR36_9VIRU|nr:MAG: structural protein [Carnarvon virus]
MAPPAPAAKKQKQQKPKKQQTHKPKKKLTPPSEKKEVKKLEKEVKQVRKKLSGPRVSDRMLTTTTIGTLFGSNTDGLNRQLRISLNPLQLKPAGSGNATSPLSLRASMYGLWRLDFLEVRVQALCGAANVVGSVALVSLCQNGLEATADSIDSLKARQYREVQIGRSLRWRVPSRNLVGPRNRWWNIDSSEDPTTSYGPALDVHLLYKTLNLLGQSSGGTTPTYTAGLWQLELRVAYSFSNYTPKPGLAKMAQVLYEGSNNSATFKPQDGNLVMEVNDAEHVLWLSCMSQQTTGLGETVWAVAGSAVDAIAPFLGPWGWLLKGGFFLVRKLFGAGANGTSTFVVYPDITAAMTDQRIKTVTQSGSASFPLVHVSQVTQPNPDPTATSSGVTTNPTLAVTSFPTTSAVAHPFQPESPLYYLDSGQKVDASSLPTGSLCFVGPVTFQEPGESVKWDGISSTTYMIFNLSNTALFVSSTNYSETELPLKLSTGLTGATYQLWPAFEAGLFRSDWYQGTFGTGWNTAALNLMGAQSGERYYSHWARAEAGNYSGAFSKSTIVVTKKGVFVNYVKANDENTMKRNYCWYVYNTGNDKPWPSHQVSSFFPTSRPLDIEGPDTDDTESIADSFMALDEPDHPCDPHLDHIDQQRADLIRRLRQLELARDM